MNSSSGSTNSKVTELATLQGTILLGMHRRLERTLAELRSALEAHTTENSRSIAAALEEVQRVSLAIAASQAECLRYEESVTASAQRVQHLSDATENAAAMAAKSIADAEKDLDARFNAANAAITDKFRQFSDATKKGAAEIEAASASATKNLANLTSAAQGSIEQRQQSLSDEISAATISFKGSVESAELDFANLIRSAEATIATQRGSVNEAIKKVEARVVELQAEQARFAQRRFAATVTLGVAALLILGLAVYGVLQS